MNYGDLIYQLYICIFMYLCVLKIWKEDRHIALRTQSAVNATWRAVPTKSCRGTRHEFMVMAKVSSPYTSTAPISRSISLRGSQRNELFTSAASPAHGMITSTQ